MKSTTRLAVTAALSLAASTWSGADTSAIPTTMLAAAFDRGGGPEVLTLHHLPVPKPGEGEVLIAVQAAGVGAWEVDERRHPSPDTPFPVVLGSDGAGTVAALGPGVRGFKLGDAVYGTGHGFYAQYATTPADQTARVPKGIGMSEAGILAISGLSALQGIDDLLHVRVGDTLIVHGATGGVGTLAIQFAKLRGAKVLATATSDEGLELARRLGADVVINGRTGDIAAAARRLAPNGVDAVLGLAGGEALERCIDTLRDAAWPRPRRLFVWDGASAEATLRHSHDALQLHLEQTRIGTAQPGGRSGKTAGADRRGVFTRRCRAGSQAPGSRPFPRQDRIAYAR